MDLFKELADESVDCVITSPPYWQLRDYKWEGQWGLEPTFQMYLENLWTMMDEVWRVLKPTGTVWINLGDTYSGGGGGNYGIGKNVSYCENIQGGKNIGEIKNKCLLLIPHRFAIGCIDRGWIMRNDIVWAKRNAMPESVTDRFSKKHEYFFFMAKNDKYFFDLDGVKDRAVTKDSILRDRDSNKLNNTPGRTPMGGLTTNGYDTRNPGTVSDFWDIPTKPSQDEHYAAYNDRLIGKPIVAGCPQYICIKCGKPREKIIENIPMVVNLSKRGEKMGLAKNKRVLSGTMVSPAKNIVIGFTDCGCNAGFTPGIILDPFCGTATTGCRALELGRKFIGFEGSEKFVKMGNKNLLPYLQQTNLFP